MSLLDDIFAPYIGLSQTMQAAAQSQMQAAQAAVANAEAQRQAEAERAKAEARWAEAGATIDGTCEDVTEVRQIEGPA